MKLSNKLKVIILLGPPGSGKGTQAELLAERFNLYYLETSEIIENNFKKAKKGDFVSIEGKKYFLLEEKKIRKEGKLMSPPLITFWVNNKVKEVAKENKGIVTAGSPRTLYEGKEVIPLLKRLYGPQNIKTILIKLTPEQSIWRNIRRRTCELMRHPILYTRGNSKLKKCPLDGSRLLIRKDDNPETIKIRLREYKERTLPLVDCFKNQGLKVKQVNGEQSVERVFKDILKAIKSST